MLEDSDIRNLIRLLGEVSILEVDLSQKKVALLNGMCRLIDGDGWAWSLRGPSEDKASVVCLNALSGGDVKVLPPMLFPSAVSEAVSSQGKQPVGLAAKDYIQLRNSIQARVAAAKIEYAATDSVKSRLTISTCQISGDTVSFLHFGRGPGREPFSPREEMMARIFCEEIPWLHEAPQKRSTAKLKLTLRQMATLTLLIEGLSQKAIAERLRLSPNTVHGYIKEIYRYFGTHSHAELMKRQMLSQK